jgi:hypothetical protein
LELGRRSRRDHAQLGHLSPASLYKLCQNCGPLDRFLRFFSWQI